MNVLKSQSSQVKRYSEIPLRENNGPNPWKTHRSAMIISQQQAVWAPLPLTNFAHLMFFFTCLNIQCLYLHTQCFFYIAICLDTCSISSMYSDKLPVQFPWHFPNSALHVFCSGVSVHCRGLARWELLQLGLLQPHSTKIYTYSISIKSTAQFSSNIPKRSRFSVLVSLGDLLSHQ